MAAILDRDPPALTTLQPLAPPLLDHVVARCLAKDPDERWQSAGDVMRELTWVAQTGATSTQPVSAPVRAAGLSALRGLLRWCC